MWVLKPDELGELVVLFFSIGYFSVEIGWIYINWFDCVLVFVAFFFK